MAPLYDKIERRQAADYFSRAKGGNPKGKLSVSDLSMANRLPRNFSFWWLSVWYWLERSKKSMKSVNYIKIGKFWKKRIGLIKKNPVKKSVTSGKIEL
jgi:hypothetical protein